MRNNIYVKVILTIIAVELGIMIFKNNRHEIMLNKPINGQSAIVQTNSTMPNPLFNQDQKVPMDGEIVDIPLESFTGANKDVLPVGFSTFGIEGFTMKQLEEKGTVIQLNTPGPHGGALILIVDFDLKQATLYEVNPKAETKLLFLSKRFYNKE